MVVRVVLLELVGVVAVSSGDGVAGGDGGGVVAVTHDHDMRLIGATNFSELTK